MMVKWKGILGWGGRQPAQTLGVQKCVNKQGLSRAQQAAECGFVRQAHLLCPVLGHYFLPLLKPLPRGGDGQMEKLMPEEDR